jgi:hypothetical protein
METRERIRHIEEDASLPTGCSERFAGYAVVEVKATTTIASRPHELRRTERRR